MLEAFKKWGTDFVLKTKDLFTTSESQVYVKDLRKVMVYKDGRKYQYPKNYDQIVESGKIIEGQDSNGKIVYKLLYGEENKNGRPVFELTEVTEIDDRSYFTIKFLVDKGKVNKNRRDDNDDYSGFYKPFGFLKIDLEKHLPVFEAQRTENPKYPFQLTNSSVLTKKEKNEKGEVEKVIDKEGRNGELLYTSDYKKLNTSFFEVRDQSNNLELDKSLISVPIVFAAGLAKVCTKWLTRLPMKLGEYLVSRENPIAKSFGYFLFTPAVAVKNLVNMGATILKAPILLFVADEKKYGDAYWTMWKQQLKECWEEVKSDYSVVKDGKRLEPKKEDYPEHKIAGTWKELDARRPGIEKDLEEQGNDKEVSKSNEILSDKAKSHDMSNNKRKNHVESLQNRRNLQKEQGATPPF